MDINRILKNKLVIYVITRYGTYALQFLISIIIAAKLGPFYMGVYGLILLILQYFSQVNFGIHHALNIYVIHNKKEVRLCESYLVSSLTIFSIVAVVLLVSYVIYLGAGLTLFGDYNIDKYLLLIVVIAILAYYNLVLSIYVRAKNHVNALSLMQSINVLCNLAVLFFFEAEQLVGALVVSLLAGNALSIYIAYRCNIFPNINSVNVNLRYIKDLIYKGIPLFFNNSAFYFILISVRTIVSSNYSVSEFGIFTFAFTIANAVMLLLDSLSTAVYPKIIDNLSSDDMDIVERTISMLRSSYISMAHLLIYVALICYPIFLKFMPQYSDGVCAISLISLAVLMNTNSFGYSTLLVARNKEKISAFNSVVALIINIAIGFVLVKTFHVDYSYVIISTLFSYIVFSFLSVYFGKRILGIYNIIHTVKDFFPIRLLIPYIAALVIVVLQFQYLIFIPLLLYLIFNYKDIIKVVELVKKMILNPNIADI